MKGIQKINGGHGLSYRKDSARSFERETTLQPTILFTCLNSKRYEKRKSYLFGL